MIGEKIGFVSRERFMPIGNRQKYSSMNESNEARWFQ